MNGQSANGARAPLAPAASIASKRKRPDGSLKLILALFRGVSGMDGFCLPWHCFRKPGQAGDLGGGVSVRTFGATDAPLKGPELEKSRLVQFPMVMGGIVPVVNLDGVAPGELVLDGRDRGAPNPLRILPLLQLRPSPGSASGCPSPASGPRRYDECRRVLKDALRPEPACCV